MSKVAVLALAMSTIAGPATLQAADRLPDLTAELATCPIAPARDSVRVDCCGVYGSSSMTPSELMDAFPNSSGGRPIIGVGLGVRPPGLAFRFSDAMRLHLIWNEEGVSFEPSEIASYQLVTADSVFVSWPPLLPRKLLGSSFFGGGNFMLEMMDSSWVVITATVNLVATYASPGDTAYVWGTEIGMPDIQLRSEGLASPTAVAPATWGQVKATWGIRNPGQR